MKDERGVQKKDIYEEYTNRCGVHLHLCVCVYYTTASVLVLVMYVHVILTIPVRYL